MADGNEESLLWGLNFARHVFLLKLVTLCVYHALKCRYVRQRRKQEGLYRRSINRMEAYERWRAQRNQMAYERLISVLSRSRTVVRSLWSKQRSGCWWDVEKRMRAPIVNLDSTHVCVYTTFSEMQPKFNLGSTHLRRRTALTWVETRSAAFTLQTF